MRLMEALLLAGIMAVPAAAATPPGVAVFPLELYDTSGEGPRADQENRLRMLDAELLARLRESGRYAPVAAELPEGSPAVRNCNRCNVKAAEQLGATLALSGVVHKVSNLILTLTLVLREVPSGETRHVWRADFRGNTDESWQHALRWLLRHRVLAAPEPAQ